MIQKLQYWTAISLTREDGSCEFAMARVCPLSVFTFTPLYKLEPLDADFMFPFKHYCAIEFEQWLVKHPFRATIVD
jgi:hypothetical protein